MNSSSINDFIESGILEAYVTGAVSEAEEMKVLYMREAHPEVKEALERLEVKMEEMAKSMAIAPPPDLWNRIENELDGIVPVGRQSIAKKDKEQHKQEKPFEKQGSEFIEVEGESSHMRIHKAWKWVFAAVFILGKIFLAAAIYFYLENRQAQQNIIELKQELRKVESSRKQ